MDTPDDMTIDVDESAMIFSGDEFYGTSASRTRMLRVDYGDGLGPVGEISVPVPASVDPGQTTHLTMRVGNVIDATDVTGCEAESDEPVRFDVQLGRGGMYSDTQTTGRLTQQYHYDAAAPDCNPVQALQTCASISSRGASSAPTSSTRSC
jgi:hypothetical protein